MINSYKTDCCYIVLIRFEEIDVFPSTLAYSPRKKNIPSIQQTPPMYKVLLNCREIKIPEAGLGHSTYLCSNWRLRNILINFILELKVMSFRSKIDCVMNEHT